MQVENSHDKRTVLQCQDVTHRFLANNALTRKPEVLRMLLKLNELSNKQEEGTIVLTQTSPLSSARSGRDN